MGRPADGIRVLHVDDDQALAETVVLYLEREDERFETVTASGADEGMERLADGEFDCVVSDYEMPGRNGIEFLRSVRDAYPNLPFILYTGRGSEEVASEAISAGATDYLQKESGTEHYTVLANRIDNAVERAQSQRAERHLRELAENTERVLYIFTHDWDELLFVNSAYESLWGQSIDALHADSSDFLRGVHPDDRARVRDAMDRVSDGETLEVEMRVDTERDFDRWVQARGEPITNETGEVVRVAGFVADITERKELQRTLEEQTERLQEAQRVAGVGSWEWDAASDTVVWSEETYRIFGWDLDASAEPTFEDWLDDVHPDDREKARNAVEEAMETGSFPTFEHRVRRPSGEVVWVRCRGEVKREDGDTTGITGIVLDITDRRAAGSEE